jgi:hypothetical protein
VLTSKGDNSVENYILQLPILASLIIYTTDWELHLLVINLKGSIYYFINNIWYKYTGKTKQKDKYLMADKKLRIHRKLKIEQHKYH